jgi:hypothetical protein
MIKENEVKKYIQFYGSAFGKRITEKDIVDAHDQSIASLYVFEGKKL